MTTQIKITRRSVVGYGWSNAIERNDGRPGCARIQLPRGPDVVGRYRALLAGRAEARKINSGGIHYAEALFVRGRMVAERVGDVLDQLEYSGSAVVTLRGAEVE